MKSDKTTPNVPTLRFPNYNGEWQKTVMGKVCSFRKGYGIAKDDLSSGGTPCILYGELYTTYKTAIAKTIKSKTSIQSKSLVYSQKDDVIIPCSGETAEDIATSICVPYDGILLGGDLTIVHSDLDGAFLSNQINSVRKFDIARIAQGKSIVHLQADELKKIFIFYPSIQEQRKISAFIDKIDKRIEIQNKIIEDLKVLKKELCAKLFGSPLCGRIIAIEQVADIYGGYAFNSKAYVNKGKYKIVTIGNVTGDKYISGNYNTIDRLPNNIQKPQVLSKGDILVSLTGNVGRISIVDGDEYLLNQRVAKLGIEDDLTKEYIYQYLSNSSFEKDMINAGQGAAQKNIKNQDILSYCIRFPTDQTALENIDKLLSLYDMRITSEKAILSNLILQKSYYLRAMFI